MQKTILVLFGGRSPEHDISLRSAAAVLSHMDPSRWKALPVYITNGGAWRYCPDTSPDGNWQEDGIPCVLLPDYGRAALLLLDGTGRELTFDAAFPILHGRNGEDGTVQGLIELTGAPLVGCGVLSSALCMDKDRAHKLAHAAGVPVPCAHVIDRNTDTKLALSRAEELGYPLFIKPVKAGSSFGITKVTEQSELPAAIEHAFRYDDEILMEECISGFEVGCAVIGNGKLTVGEPDEIELSGDYFDYSEKYMRKTSAIHVPARVSEAKAAEIKETARRIYKALGCRGFARVDMFLDNDGRIVFNEVNTIPGLTELSRFPNMMRAAGMFFEQVISTVIGLAVDE